MKIYRSIKQIRQGRNGSNRYDEESIAVKKKFFDHKGTTPTEDKTSCNQLFSDMQDKNANDKRKI